MKIVLASQNSGKLAEFERMFQNKNIKILPQTNFDMPSIEETGLTFIENALLKARNACQHTGLPAIADDSGLICDALNGAPGIYSARFAGKNPTREKYSEKLLEALAHVEQSKRAAHFHCTLVFLRHAEDPAPIIAEGVWNGLILKEPIGKGGFGYDPVFYVPELGCSAAQLSPEQKNHYSHRAKAMQKLLQKLS